MPTNTKDHDAFERQRIKLAESLSTVAESMRNCATIADKFANFVRQTPFSEDSPIFQMSNFDASNGAAEEAQPKSRKRKGAANDEVAPTAKRKRATKPKDPNAPKRPASSYILFQNAVRMEMKATNPNMTNHELLAMISKKWQEMSAEDKAVYTQASAGAKEQYAAEMKVWESRSSAEIAAADIANAAAAAAKRAAPRGRAPKVVEKPEPAPEIPAAMATTGSDSSGSDDESSDDEPPAEPAAQDEAEDDEDDRNTESSEAEEAPKPPPPKITKKVVASKPTTKKRTGKA